MLKCADLLQDGHAGIRDGWVVEVVAVRRAGEIEHLEGRERLEVHKPRVGDLRVVQVQCLEPRALSQVAQPLIGDLKVGKVERPQRRDVSQVVEGRVREIAPEKQVPEIRKLREVEQPVVGHQTGKRLAGCVLRFAAESKLLETGQVRELREPGVGNAVGVEVEAAKRVHPADVDHARVGQTLRGAQAFERRQVSEVAQARVPDVARLHVEDLEPREPGDMGHATVVRGRARHRQLVDRVRREERQGAEVLPGVLSDIKPDTFAGGDRDRSLGFAEVDPGFRFRDSVDPVVEALDPADEVGVLNLDAPERTIARELQDAAAVAVRFARWTGRGDSADRQRGGCEGEEPEDGGEGKLRSVVRAAEKGSDPLSDLRARGEQRAGRRHALPGADVPEDGHKLFRVVGAFRGIAYHRLVARQLHGLGQASARRSGRGMEPEQDPDCIANQNADRVEALPVRQLVTKGPAKLRSGPFRG